MNNTLSMPNLQREADDTDKFETMDMTGKVHDDTVSGTTAGAKTPGDAGALSLPLPGKGSMTSKIDEIRAERELIEQRLEETRLLSLQKDLEFEEYLLRQRVDRDKLLQSTPMPNRGRQGTVPDLSFITGTGAMGNGFLHDGNFTGNTNMNQLIDVLQLPKSELPTFSGDPLKFWTFVRAFEHAVGSKDIDDNAKLIRLVNYCTGKARKTIECCAVMEPSAGFTKAKQLLRQRFGNDYVIAEACVRSVTVGAGLKANDHNGLQDFADELRNCVETLAAMDRASDIDSTRSLANIVERLPPFLQHRWRKAASDTLEEKGRYPSIWDLVRFVERAAREANDPVFGKMHASSSISGQANPGGASGGKVRSEQRQRDGVHGGARPKGSSFNVQTVTSDSSGCVLCNGGHGGGLFGCDKFKKMRPDERLKFTRSKSLCDNCLKSGHFSDKCTLTRTCSVEGCNRKHTKFLHIAPRPSQNPGMSKYGPNRSVPDSSTSGARVESERQGSTKPVSCVANVQDEEKNHGAGATPRTVLPILQVRVFTEDNREGVTALALLDSGSTNSFCSQDLADRLNVNGTRTTLSLTTLGQANCHCETKVVSLKVAEFHEHNAQVDMPYTFVQPSLALTAGPLTLEDTAYPHLRGIHFPEISGRQVDLIVGQDVPDALIPVEVRKGKQGEPYACRTLLGWTLNGPVGLVGNVANFHCMVKQDDALCTNVKKLWELENPEMICEDKRQMSVTDKKVVELWDKTTTFHDGRYEMAIPFKEREPRLENNFPMACKRLNQLRARFLKDPALFSRYKQEIHKLIDEGYAERVENGDTQADRGRTFYIPHHCVKNENKPEKLRLVFDCAAKFNGRSLNDVVLSGPDMANKLVGVLLKFREGKVAMMSDIEAMYYQIKVKPEDRDVLRFLWWADDDMSREPEVLRMTVHPFGGVWAPSAATYALRRTAADNRGEFDDDVIETVHRNFYVDDCLKAMHDTQQSIALAQDLTALLDKGGFRLCKWLSNRKEVNQSIPVAKRAKTIQEIDMDLDKLPTDRALGTKWNVEEDTLTFNVKLRDKPCTRRGLLSVIASVYDPLGLVSPFALTAKRILQDACRLQIPWDDPLPEEQKIGWERWCSGLLELENFSVPRCVIPADFGEIVQRELHHFSDGSTSGMGTASYLRLVDNKGGIHCSLLMGKARLNPLKPMTIPRLELSAAVQAVRVDKMLREELDMEIGRSYFWTDSMLVLEYVKNETKRFHTFVANRIAIIQASTVPTQWRYVESSRNPADDPSRGLSAEELLKRKRWTQGPGFLWGDESSWPSQSESKPEILKEDPEVKTKPVVYATAAENPKPPHFIETLEERYSSWHKLRGVVAWILRFKRMLLAKVKKTDVGIKPRKTLSLIELREAEIEIVKCVQARAFPEEIKALKAGQGLKRSSRLYALEPSIDGDGMLRVGGRLRKAPLKNDTRHPAVLPKDSHVTTLIIRMIHEFEGHSGREHVLAAVRTRYWVLQGRYAVNQVIRNCIKCRRQRGQLGSQRMADLPVDRVTPFKPVFSFVGVDCFGPFLTKRGRSVQKRYGCIFTCLSVRAVHVEVLNSMDTDSFLNALQRFMCRRGKPEKIRCDNGSNFTSGDKELRRGIAEWNKERIETYLHQRDVEFEYNPPAASHMGGSWERQIRTIRKVLNSVLTEQPLDDECLTTLMCLVEAVINGRPITPLPDSPEDLEPLTPNHLILLRSTATLPPGIFAKQDMFRKRWRQAQYLADVFWRRWIREYLPTIQFRSKWFEDKPNLQIGDVVLVMDETTPRNLWPLAKVVETFPGDDGLVRSVLVKTKSTTLKRPVTKLCLLESVAFSRCADMPNKDSDS